MDFEILTKKWKFEWDAMDVLIGGKSSIDLSELKVRNFEDAGKFIKNYGFDLDKSSDQRLIHSVFIEAMNFIEKQLVPFEGRGGRTPPPSIRRCFDVRNLLIAASSQEPEHKQEKAWACALLRVMHTIAHIEGVHRHIDLQVASQQIEKRFRNNMFIDADGKTWLGPPGAAVQIYRFDIKRAKTRESTLLKLLHKPGNVAETIFDLIGIRIITKRLSDVMVVVKYLRQFYMITLPNTNPSRARNTLLDVNQFRSNISMMRKMLEQQKIVPTEFEKLIEQLTKGAKNGNQNTVNPHSSLGYRAIQLTCRQLIRIPNPILGWFYVMEDFLQGNKLDESQAKLIQGFMHYIRSWPNFSDNMNVSAFLPFEVQVLDKASFQESLSGTAAHDRYKRMQIKTARRRVLGEVLKLRS